MPFLMRHEIAEREPYPGYKGRFVHGSHITTVDWTIDQDAAFPEHSHPHEQIMHLLDGTFELTIDGETRSLQAGAVAVIAPGSRHSGRAATACRVVDVFHPVREDFR